MKLSFRFGYFQTFFKVYLELEPVVEIYQGLLLVLPTVHRLHCLARLWIPFKTNQFFN